MSVLASSTSLHSTVSSILPNFCTAALLYKYSSSITPNVVVSLGVFPLIVNLSGYSSSPVFTLVSSSAPNGCKTVIRSDQSVSSM